MSIVPNPRMKKLKMGYGLFKMTQQHHKNCLRKLFLAHYTPLIKGFKPNKFWTTHLPVDVMNKLRLHLSWVRGGDVTHWNDEQIGKKIVFMYHKSKVLPLFIRLTNFQSLTPHAGASLMQMMNKNDEQSNDEQ